MKENGLLLAFAPAVGLAFAGIVYGYVISTFGRNINVALVIVAFTAAMVYLEPKTRNPFLRLIFLVGIAIAFVIAIVLATGRP